MKRSRSCPLGVALAAACLWMAYPKPTLAQSGSEADNVTGNAGPQLRLSTSSRQFQSGEVIPLELTFTSATTDRYQINLAQYDRSGRMNYD